jgi:hypothetical protein
VGRRIDRAGIPPVIWWPEAEAQGMSEKEYWAYYYKIQAARNSIPHGDADQKEGGTTIWDKLNGRLNPLVEEILALKATTIDGLKVQARAVAVAEEPLDGDSDDWSPEQNFIRGVFAFIGVDGNGKAVAA